jgi:hypothetical protein
MHAAYWGDEDTEHTRLAWAVGLEAEAERAGNAPRTANTPRQTMKRRVMIGSSPNGTRGSTRLALSMIDVRVGRAQGLPS